MGKFQFCKRTGFLKKIPGQWLDQLYFLSWRDGGKVGFTGEVLFWSGWYVGRMQNEEVVQTADRRKWRCSGRALCWRDKNHILLLWQSKPFAHLSVLLSKFFFLLSHFFCFEFLFSKSLTQWHSSFMFSSPFHLQYLHLMTFAFCFIFHP